MPTLRPFAGLRYDPRVVPDVGSVLCPPYDIIAEGERARLAAHPYNAVHLELPSGERDPRGSDRYESARGLLHEWRDGGVLRRDEAPAVYAYEVRYASPAAEGEQVARGFFCELRLEQPASGGVQRHEQTMDAPKEDRLRLLRAVRANLSPVLLLYDDRADGARTIELVNGLAAEADLVTDVRDDRGARHRLWLAAADGAAARELLAVASAGPLTIADGHHRYETALRYRDEPGAGPRAAWVMALLFDGAAGGLTVLPTHRLVTGVPNGPAELGGLVDLFEIERRDDPVSVVRAVAEAGPGTIGVWTRDGGGLMRPRHDRLAALMPEASAALRALDVAALGIAMERMLGRDARALADAGALSYTKDADEGLAEVAEGRADACFILAPTPVEVVMAIAGAGEVMPPKSTYFVPKAATGLVFNALD